jgi:feruloyl-CoA synthase
MNGHEKIIPDFAPARVEVEQFADGSFVLRSPVRLEQYASNVCEYLEHWATSRPDQNYLAERDGKGDWRFLTYGEALTNTRSIAQALLDAGAGPARPLMVLSDNSIANGLLQLAAMYVGVPVAPVSPAYSLMSGDFGKLRYVFDLVSPALVFASDDRFARALGALDLDATKVISLADTTFADLLFADIAATPTTTAVDRQHAGVGPETVAKILFTSGSTGMPKGVINTHRMMCSNQQAMAQIWPFASRRPPVLVDWLPWNHTFGGNHNFNFVLRHGGTLYIDEGRPMPGLIEKTVANLKEVAPSIYFNVPRGYDMLVPYLERDKALRENFFSELDVLFYAAAALPQNLWDRLENVSMQALDARISMISGWGSTETAPVATEVHFPTDKAGIIGLPVPGTELKFVPNAGKLEMRVRGPNVFPGYFKQDDLTASAFDDEGYYLIGDAGKLADAGDPAKGVVFDGRVAEDFKLLTGSWVSTGTVRVAAIAAASPVVQDAVVAGHDRDEIGLLLFLNAAGASAVAGTDGDASMHVLANEPAIRRHIAAGIGAYNRQNPASSTRIGRLIILLDPPDIDAGEITDKGYLNQRAVLEKRADRVGQLYSDHAAVIIPD